MAVKHIVLIEPNNSVDDATMQGLIDQMIPLLLQIPGVQDANAGKNFTDRAPPGVTHALVVTLDTKDSLAGYGPHPIHQQVLGLLKPAVKNVAAVDFEV